jgi:hypothetical protein
MKLLIFMLIAYGISNILVFGSIFEKWRTFWSNVNPGFFGMLFTCMICLPTYAGFLGSWLIYSPSIDYGIVTESLSVFGLFVIPKTLIAIFIDGCMTSGVVWLIHSFQEALERHSSK